MQTEFTNADRVRRDRLQAHAVEAAEQCGGTYVPEVAELRKLADLLSDWPADRKLMFCDEALAGTARPWRRRARGTREKWAILIGPEGGFSDPERARLAALPFARAVSLGPRILRADTAAVAALTVWQQALGTGDEPRPPRGRAAPVIAGARCCALALGEVLAVGALVGILGAGGGCCRGSARAVALAGGLALIAAGIQRARFRGKGGGAGVVRGRRGTDGLFRPVDRRDRRAGRPDRRCASTPGTAAALALASQTARPRFPLAPRGPTPVRRLRNPARARTERMLAEMRRGGDHPRDLAGPAPRCCIDTPAIAATSAPVARQQPGGPKTMSIPQSGGGPIERVATRRISGGGCKPREDWRIGTEHEKFGYCATR